MRRLFHRLPLIALWAVPLQMVPGQMARAQAPQVHTDFVSKQWTLREGLPGNSVHDVHQTEDGYLWLATGNGIARFDGIRFSTYTTANVPSIPNNDFRDIFSPRPGELWFQTGQSHLIRYRNGTFDRPFPVGDGRLSLTYKEPASARFAIQGDTLWIGSDWGLFAEIGGTIAPALAEQPSSPIWVATLANNGDLWLGAYDGSVHQLRGGRPVAQFDEESGLPGVRVHDIADVGEGRLLVGTRDGLFEHVGDRFEQVIAGPSGHFTNTRVIRQTRDGSVHIGISPWADLKRTAGWAELVGDELEYFAAPDSSIPFAASILEDEDGMPWRFQGTTVYRQSEPVFTAPSAVHALAFDREGNVWIGTETTGLFRLRPRVFSVVAEADGLPDPRINTVLEDDAGRVWIGTQFGLALLEGDQARVWDYTRGYEGLTPTYFPRKGYSRVQSPGEETWGLYQDRSGTIWIGTNYEHCRISGERCLLPQLDGIPQDLYENVAAMHEDREGRFWLASKWGIILGEEGPQGSVWRHFSTDDGLPANWTRAIIESRAGDLLFGTYGGGVLRWNGRGFDVLSTSDGLSSNNILTLYEDEDTRLWVGTQDRGLCHVEGPWEAAAIACVSTRHGLYDNTIFSLLEDELGRLWMNSSRGIFWVDKGDLLRSGQSAARTIFPVGYTEDDGLQNRQGRGGMQPAAIRASDGRLWFATNDGVAVVDPGRVRPRFETPHALIEEVLVDGEIVTEAGVSIRPGRTRTLQVRYTAVSLSRPEDVRFRYRMAGFESTWNAASSERTATYTNLPPGQYDFEVEASIAGVWEAVPTRLRVVQRPFVWQTRWFMVLGLAALGLTVVGVVRYRIGRVETRSRELETLVEERTEQIRENEKRLEETALELRRISDLKSRFLANISHEFRTPLTLTLGPLEDVQEGRHGPIPGEARRELARSRLNARRLLRLINQLLDLSKVEAGSLILRAHRRDVVSFVRDLTALFESAAGRRGVTLQFESELRQREMAFDADKLEKVIVNLLSNAFKFTPAGGSVTVRVAGGTDHVTVDVEDTGPGIAQEHLPHIFDRFYQVDGTVTRQFAGTGIGLTLAKELVELHEGSISVTSRTGVGTVFSLLIPTDLPESGEEDTSDDSLEAPIFSSSDGYDAPHVLHVNPLEEDLKNIDQKDALVLIVDDHADMRHYVRSHLEGLFAITEAVNGADGLEKATALLPDLIVSDVMMPVMDGHEFCRRLRADERTSHIPIIMLTAKSGDEARLAGLEIGVDAYLTKPFNAPELRLRVRKLVEQREELRRRFSERVLVVGAAEVDLPSKEISFLTTVRETVESNLSSPDFGVDQLSDQIGMSRRQLLRKLKALTNETPNALVRRMRLERASQMLRQNVGSVKEIAHAAGFRSVPYFTRIFGETFGVPPATYAEEHAE